MYSKCAGEKVNHKTCHERNKKKNPRWYVQRQYQNEHHINIRVDIAAELDIIEDKQLK
jgi:hypothetical protein